ncbi:MAG: bifunctional UDP-N-acetylglucosamine diphosphorylase/glucosamine-1-phosphate N-acetyltransferase GlmU [Betaproteobacteria bacterium]|nr:bifunctional UDP-N-acetylglucosamine diphosphorylase/glucosamine-1-phosphate N-acetyltransferase GlmU [Betaproteobacteria bacterium]
MPSGLNVVILAAGQGKRMRSRLPKVLHSLAGRPLITHVIEAARALKPARICVVYGHGGEQVPQALPSDGVTFVKQQPQLGTGHALAQALPHLGSGALTLVLYGDVPLIGEETLAAMIAGGGDRLTLLTAELEDPSGYGRIVRSRRGSITGIVEEKDASAEQRKIREINTGIMALPGARLAGWLAKLTDRNAQREYYLTDVVPLALADRVPIANVKVRSTWEILGVNSKQQLAQLERIYQWQHATRLMEAGVTLADPMRLDVRGRLACGADVRIDVNCVFEGEVKLADHVEIGANCVLRNTEVGPGTRIEPFTYIDTARIGAHCRIGPYARLRPGTRLAQEVHIGNFVEVKEAEFGARSKANHLAYIGDATVGRDVNVGAGTITCNYDGANKHRTVIEDDVQIGSDVQLVAPVTIGKGATIGAGTTVWKPAPAGELTVNQKSQVTKPGWKRPQKKKSDS